MRITLQIENVDRLETGGQVSYTCTDRGFDIGRHEHLDWSLPDPQRVISGKHCEVRFDDGRFILIDVSTNGTFLNGSPNRMDKPHVLRSGDRLMIGDYVIAVALEAADSASPGMADPHAQQAQPWDMPHAAAPAPAPAAPGPAWPAQPQPQSPYPAQEHGGPWASPASGMEGRHAPPSSAPGIGTPADDVWSQQGHGWGSADPALYDPQAQNPLGAPARPAQADPLDHLAMEPHLQQPAHSHFGPQPGAPGATAPQAPPQDTGQGAPFPPFAENAPEAGTGQPLFGMPDLGEPTGSSPADAVPQPAPTPAEAPPPPPVSGDGDGVQAGAHGIAQARLEESASPFPDTLPAAEPHEPVWGSPQEAAPEAATSRPVPESAPDVSSAAVPDPEPAPVQRGEPPRAPDTPEPGVPAREAEQPATAVADVDFIRAFAEGAGIPQGILDDRDPEAFAREIGTILQGITGDLMGLLQARSQVKAMTRNANRTLISRSGNNALKFSPTPQMALQTMLSKSAEDNGYLPMPQAVSAAFKDIQKHHVWTYAAMQKAAARFEQTLSPAAIEADGGAKSTFGNPKAKLWERMQDRWTSLSGAYDDGLVGVFTQYFTESYEQLSSEDPDESGRFE